MENIVNFSVALLFSIPIVVSIIVIYFVPTAIATYRRHPYSRRIRILNIALGWTFLGWALALGWAVDAVELQRYPAHGPKNVQ